MSYIYQESIMSISDSFIKAFQVPSRKN